MDQSDVQSVQKPRACPMCRKSKQPGITEWPTLEVQRERLSGEKYTFSLYVCPECFEKNSKKSEGKCS